MLVYGASANHKELCFSTAGEYVCVCVYVWCGGWGNYYAYISSEVERVCVIMETYSYPQELSYSTAENYPLLWVVVGQLGEC